MQIIKYNHLVANIEVLECINRRRRDRQNRPPNPKRKVRRGDDEFAGYAPLSGMPGVGYSGATADAASLNRPHSRVGAKKKQMGSDPLDEDLGRGWVENHVSDYFTSTLPTTRQTLAGAEACWEELSRHPTFRGLVTAEKLQLVNTPPASVVEVHAIVEQCHKRLKEEDISELLSVINRYIGELTESYT